MKYLSLLLFGGAFAWTWGLTYNQPAIGAQTHAGIQSNLARLIINAVQVKRPQARDITILKLRTEEGEGGQIFASFQYRFVEGQGEGQGVTSTLSGIATLEKAADNQEGEDKWNLKKIQTLQDSLVFEEGEKISPGGETPAAAAEAPAETAAPGEAPAPTEPGTKTE